MSLHPITVVEDVLGEYQSYLRTEFRARDEELRPASGRTGSRRSSSTR